MRRSERHPDRQVWPRMAAGALTLLIIAAACGGSDGGDPAAEGPTPTSSAAPETPTETPPPEPTAPPTAAPTVAPSPDGEPADDELVNADPVLVDLADFEITTATTLYRAGTVTFEVGNTSDIPHEFGIARGASYAELPQLDNGSIDEDALGADFLGKTAVVDQILSPVREITFDLEVGPYVLFCNLVVGPVSHAARGQVLSITVVE